MKFEETYTYDDLLIEPNAQCSEGASHKNCSIEAKLTNESSTTFPIVMAPMKTLRQRDLFRFAIINEIVIWLDRYMDVEGYEGYQEDECYGLKEWLCYLDQSTAKNVSIAVSTKQKDWETRINEWMNHECTKGGCVKIDVANGASYRSLKAIEEIKSKFPNVFVYSGNVCSSHSAIKAMNAGADGIMVGIGGGSACSTRGETGIGKGNAHTVNEIAKALKGRAIICADGGFKKPGDVFKALALGADICMSGRLFQIGSKYYGMASSEALKSVGKEGRSTEGEVLSLPNRSIQDVKRDVNQWKGALKSALSYVDASSIQQLEEVPIHIYRITPAVYRESLAQ